MRQDSHAVFRQVYIRFDGMCARLDRADERAHGILGVLGFEASMCDGLWKPAPMSVESRADEQRGYRLIISQVALMKPDADDMVPRDLRRG